MSAPARRTWLVVVIVVLVAAGAGATAWRRQRLPAERVELGGGRPQLLEFGMGVCDQCRRLRPVMEQARRELGARVDVHVLDIRVAAHERLGDRFGLRTIPLVVLVDGSGRTVWRHEGFVAYPALAAAVARALPPPAGGR